MENQKIVDTLLKKGEIQALQAGVSSAIQDARRNLDNGISQGRGVRRGKYVSFQENIARAKSKIEEAEAIFEALQARQEGNE